MVRAEHRHFSFELHIANKGLLSLRQSDETVSVHNFPSTCRVLIRLLTVLVHLTAHKVHKGLKRYERRQLVM